MNNGIAENAVGAILEIPPTLLADIQKAERYIDNLQINSKRAADAVKTHWGETATSGLDTFIRRLADAQEMMKIVSGGKIDFNINTQPLENKLNDVSNATKKTANDVSSTVQTLAWDNIDFSNMERLKLYFETFPATFESIKATIESMKRSFSAMTTEDPESQNLANKIQLLREYYELRKKSEEQLKSKTTVSDQNTLAEQKRLLAEQLDLRKQINAQKKIVASGEITQSSKLEEERAILRQLLEQYSKNRAELRSLNREKSELSDAGKIQMELTNERQKNALLELQIKYRQDLNKELVRATELTAQTQVSKARLGNTEEAAIQRQLNSDYKAMIGIIKEIGEIKAKAAEQGRGVNQQEMALITALGQRYRLYVEDIQRVSGAFTALSEARKKAFESDRTEQLARNAIMLADAQNKAAEAANKHGLALRDTASIEQQIQNVNRQLASETLKLSEITSKAQEAKQALDEFNRVNPNNWGRTAITAEAELDKIKDKIYQLQYALVKAGDADKPAYETQIRKLKAEYDELFSKIERYKTLMYESNVDLRTETSRDNINALTKELQRLEKELQNAKDANVSINKEIANGSTVKTLASEYAKLTKRLQEVNDAMNKFQASGGNANSASFQALQTEWQNIMARRKEIEKMDIAEVNQYRQQMNQSAYQADLSAFIQAEAQKTAEAKKQAEIQSNARKEAYQKYLNTYWGAIEAANKLGTRGGNYADTFENRARVIKNLETALKNLKTTDADYEKKVESLTYWLNRLREAQNKVTDAMKPTKPQVTLADANQARKIAEQTKTLKDYEMAYKMLIEVMKQTPQGRAWDAMNRKAQEMKTHIDEIKKKMGEFQSQTNRTSNVMSQLQGRIAAAFSVGAIMGFLKKMVEVRAQFELQRVALGAIIQDRDEANKIFTQVQNMALESPFNIMQLEKATKQIAAFGFETKKLVPTMKMFADISAGLGVEIDRLVLVMGHLKARNFLEGTMVRQFTNMGFNVLGELSKYYSELEDRMVSVGEVQDRVKKKMISFEDVEEVLKRVTSQGGMFYDMQKKQSDSLWGQMQRIQDAYDLMLNEIGQSNEGILKSALTTIRNLINHWRDLKPYIVATVAAMGAFGATVFILRGIPMIVSNITRGFNMMGVALGFATKQQLALNAAQKANAWGAILSVVVAVTVALIEAASAQSKLNEELERIGSNTTDSLNESIATFKQLADTISNVNSTYSERTEAMTEMRRVYADILPKEKLEIDYIQSLRGNYGELTKAIQDYYQQKEYNQKMEAIQGSDEAKKVQEELENVLNRMNEEGFFDMKYSKSMIKSWSDTIAKEINTGKIPASLDSLEARIKEVFKAKDLFWYRDETYGQSDLHDVMQAIDKLQEKYGDITLETANAENALTSYQNSLNKFDFSQLDEAKKSLQEQKDSLQQAIEGGKKGFTGTAGGKPIFGTMQMDTSEIEELKERLKGVESQIKAVDEAQAQWLSNQFKEKVEELNKVLFDDVEKYKAARDEMRKLEMQGKKNTDEWDAQVKAMNAARLSADKTAETYGTKVKWSLIDSAQTSFDLRVELDKLATKAFPKVAELAMKSLSKLQEYLLKSKNTVYEWVKGLLEWVPESARDALGLNTILTNVNKNLALTKTQLDNLAKAAVGVEDKGKAAGKSFDELISNQAKTRVKEFGGNITDIDRIISDTSKGADAMAKELRSQAKSWEETAQSYRTSTNKALWLNTRNMTEESIALMEKNAKAAKALATDLAGVEKSSKKSGSKGKDEIAELWKNRLKVIQDFYKRYEELRKHFNEEESLTRAKDAFTPLFESLYMNINDVIAKGMGKQGLVLNLEEMTKEVAKVRKNLVDEFQKATADTQIQVDFKIKEDAENKLKQQLDDMFNSYELTEELKKLGLNVDLVFMLGGEPMDLNDLKAKLKKGFEDAGGEAAPENIVKEYKDRMDKIADLELKQRKGRIKEYNKYFVKTVGERARIELEYLKKMDEVRKMYEFTDAQRQDALRQLTEEKNKKLADQVWKDFKDGEVYQMIFKDLDNISERALVAMRTELERIRDSFKGLSPKDLKEINKAISNIDEQIVNRNPFKVLVKSFKDLFKYAKERKKNEEDFQKAIKRSGVLMDKIAEKEAQLSILREKSSLYKVDQINEEIVNLNKQIAELEKDGVTSEEESKINALKEQIRILEEKKKKLEEIAAQNKDEEDSMHNQIKGLESEVSGLNDELGESNQKAEKAGDALSEGSVKAAAIQAAFQKIKQYAEETVSHLDGIINGLDRMGALSDKAKDNWESFKDGFEAMNDVAEGGINTMTGFMTGNYAQAVNGILQGIKGTINLIATIFEAGDKKKERQIKSLSEKVEKLDKAYQKLEKSIEDAYNFAQYDSAFNSAKKNLDKQKESYEEMLALEKAKKKTDKEKVKEYEDKLEEIAEKEKELRKQMLEDMGSTTDYRNAAEGFVSAWLDAFKETGDGLDALNDKWDEFIENMFIKQAALARAGKIYANVIDILNKAFDEGKRGDDLQEAIDEAHQAAMDGNKDLNDYLKALAEIFHIKPDDNGELVLSDLQKGIQNITEPQAAAIEAYLNSMRFEVFRHTEQLERLITAVQMQYGGTADNPVVTELKGIRNVLDSIDSKFDSVIGKTGIQKGIRIAN